MSEVSAKQRPLYIIAAETPLKNPHFPIFKYKKGYPEALPYTT